VVRIADAATDGGGSAERRRDCAELVRLGHPHYGRGLRDSGTDENSPHSTADTADVAEIRAAAELYRLSAAEAVSYLEGETSALLAAGVKPSRIAAALKVVVTAAAKEQEPPAAVDGAAATEKVWPRRGGAPTYHPKRPVRKVAAASAGASSISVAEACTFLAMNPNVSFERKKSFLLSKGVSTFTIAQAACTASNAALVL